MRKYSFISKESGEYQKKIAIKMWEFVKKWYLSHPDEYHHPMDLKQKFCDDYFDKTGQRIDWLANCMLCNIFHDDYCQGCPLYSGDNCNNT